MDEFGTSEDLPSSPWAHRFPISSLTVRSEDTNHSLLAPEFPRINDPKYYDREPRPSDNPPQNNSEIDRVLLSEECQRNSLTGVTTWSIAALRRHVQFSAGSGVISGGHQPTDAIGRTSPFLFPSPPPPSPAPRSLRPGLQLSLATMLAARGLNEERNFEVYQRERIQVDETRWLPFWRKSSWFDWIDVSHPPIKPAGRTWSVDDPEVWSVLSVVLELADRIMLALIVDRNDGVSETMIIRGPLFDAYTDYWENYRDEFGDGPSPDAMLLLSYAAEQKMSRNRGEASCDWGDSIASHPSADWADRLSKLLQKTIFSFAEIPFAEGLTQARPWFNDKEYPYDSVVVVDTKALEVMMRPDLALEELCTLQVNCAIIIVHEIMHSIIIGRYNENGYAGNMLDKARTGKDAAEEPYLDGQGASEMGRYMEQSFFGGCSSLLPLNGDIEPRPKPLAMVFFEWPYPGETRRIAPGSDFIQDGYLNTSYHVPSAWCAKMLSESFWQDPSITRKSENNFHRNPVFIVNYETRGGTKGPARKPAVQDLDLLPYKYPEDQMSVEAWEERIRIWESHRAAWYVRSVIEARNLLCHRCKFGAINNTSGIGRTPSKEAAAARHDHVIHADVGGSQEVEWENVRPRRFYNCFRYRDERLENHTQLDYLQLIDDVVEYIVANNAIIPISFVNAIVAAAIALREDRVKIVENYGFGHAARWASDWFFKMPEYDPTWSVLDNGEWKEYQLDTVNT
ncbi:hypothetical protein GGR51DRAFT_566510 [Nemania sp. FL0031]|nr:hypothetical protein GGR51DRAFT_566510 [Nemania sp. FL0031]